MRQSLGNSRLVRPYHDEADSRLGRGGVVRSGRSRHKLCHAHRHNRLDNSSERLCFSFSLFLYLSLSLPSQLLVCTLVHSPSFLVPPPLFLCFPLYIFPTFLFSVPPIFPRPRILPLTSPSSCCLLFLVPSRSISFSFLASPYPPLLQFFALFLSHPLLIVSFTFSQSLVE